MNLDDLLSDALHDERLALPVPPDTLTRVRRARARRQRARAVGAVAATSSLVLAGVLVSSSIGPTTPSSSLQPGAGGAAVASGCNVAPPATPVPGSTPAYPIQTARDWFMTQAQNDSFYAGFQQPSPGPGYYAASPAPAGPGSMRLREEVIQGGVPGTSQFTLDDVANGRRGNLAVYVSLAAGDRVYVGREPAIAPYNTEADANASAQIEDVPGTGCVALLHRESPGQQVRSVTVVAPDGWTTLWVSETVPLAQLRTWAFAAAQWASSHPE